MHQSERAENLRKLHTRRPLILPNAWDAASARVFEALGAEAIATTSAGVSWTFGRSDGQKLNRQEMLDVIRNIVRSVNVPVTADIESGYGNGSVNDVAKTVEQLVSIGVAGINIEDSPGRNGQALLTADEHAERIRIARKTAGAAGCDLVINVRTDVYLFQVGDPDSRFDNIVERAKVYRSAGADCIFVPGVVDSSTIASLVKAIDYPLNVMVAPGAPNVKSLGEMGVARVSVGPGITQVALAAAQRAARELLEHGTYGVLETGLPFAEVNTLFTPRPQ